MSEWFEDESFWIEMYPHLFPEERLRASEEEVDRILSLVGFQGTSVLDLCCGPGRHSMVLAKKGFAVTGVDRTAFLLEKARAKAKEENLRIEWIQQDMRDFLRPGEYDLVLSMFTSFGYFENKEEDLKVLGNIFKNLKSGGVCLIDVMSKERIAKILQPTTAVESPDGSLLVERHEIFDDWSRIRNEWIVIKDGNARSFTFHHTIYSGQELKDRLMLAGFTKVELFGDLEGAGFGPDAPRLIAVARS